MRIKCHDKSLFKEFTMIGKGHYEKLLIIINSKISVHTECDNLILELFNISYNLQCEIWIYDISTNLIKKFISSLEMIIYIYDILNISNDIHDIHITFNSVKFFNMINDNKKTLILNCAFFTETAQHNMVNLQNSLIMAMSNKINVFSYIKLSGIPFGPVGFTLLKELTLDKILETLHDKYNINNDITITKNVIINDDTKCASANDIFYSIITYNDLVTTNINTINNNLYNLISNKMISYILHELFKKNKNILFKKSNIVKYANNKKINFLYSRIYAGFKQKEKKLKNMNHNHRLITNIIKNIKNTSFDELLKEHIFEDNKYNVIRFKVKSTLNTYIGINFDPIIVYDQSRAHKAPYYCDKSIAISKLSPGYSEGILPIYPGISAISYSTMNALIGFSFGKSVFNYWTNMKYCYFDVFLQIFLQCINHKYFYDDNLFTLLLTIEQIDGIICTKKHIKEFIKDKKMRSSLNEIDLIRFAVSMIFRKKHFSKEQLFVFYELIIIEYFRKIIARSLDKISSVDIPSLSFNDVLLFLNDVNHIHLIKKIEGIAMLGILANLIDTTNLKEAYVELFKDQIELIDSTLFYSKYKNKSIKYFKSFYEYFGKTNYESYVTKNFILGIMFKKNSVYNKHFNIDNIYTIEMNPRKYIINKISEIQKTFLTKLII